jgi:O-antigen biosynthesis protein
MITRVRSSGPTVSLLMPNRNNAGVLDLMLSRLAENTTYPDFELIVVDDGSTDSSRRILRRWRDQGRFRSFTLIEADHRGVQASLNTAAEASSGELLVQMDGDATVETRGWLDQMVAFQRSAPAVAVVSAAVILDNGRVHAYGVNLIDPKGMHDRGTEIIEPVGRRTLHSAVRRPRARKVPPPEGAVEVDASIGCCMLYPRALLEEVGGYDLGFSPVWFEDVDLSLAARRLGSKVFLLGDVRVLHRGNLAEEHPSAARRAARLLPQAVKDVIVAAGRMEQPPPAVLERLRAHYAHWREKWGFDPLNPDMAEVFARYGDTEVCWRHDDAMRAAGEEIAATWVKGVNPLPA